MWSTPHFSTLPQQLGEGGRMQLVSSLQMQLARQCIWGACGQEARCAGERTIGGGFEHRDLVTSW